MSEDLRQIIIEIICDEWPTPDGYLLSAAIYERLRSQGVQVTHAALNNVLSEVAASGRITLSLVGGGDPDLDRTAGGDTMIHDVSSDLCP
jgi:hypothetical protein